MICDGLVSRNNLNVSGKQPLRGGSRITEVFSGENFCSNVGKTSSTVEEMNSPLEIFLVATFFRADLIASWSYSTPTNDSTKSASSIPKNPTPQYKSTRCFAPPSRKNPRTVSTSFGSRKKLFWKKESGGTSQFSGGIRSTTLIPPFGGGFARTCLICS